MENLDKQKKELDETIAAAMILAKYNNNFRHRFVRALDKFDSEIKIIATETKVQYPADLLINEPIHSDPGNVQGIANKIKTYFMDHGVDVDIENCDVNAQISRYSCFIHSAKEPVKVTKAEKDLLKLLKNNSVRIVKNSKTIDVEISNKTLGTVDFGELINYKVTDLVDPLTYVVGKDMTNVYGSLTKANGIIISGGSASGKQATIRDIIDSILYRNSRDDIEIDFLNLKYSDFEIYNKAPQVIMVADTPELVAKTLDNLLERMDICFDLLSKTKMKNIEEFNDSAYGDRKMRHTIIVIDELAKLLEIDRKIEDKLIRILQVGRAVGYHLIICTGENDSISVKLNANCMDKIILKDGLDKEADKLIGLGDAFYDSVSGKEHVRRRVQIAFHSQGDTQKICEYLEANSK